VSNIPKVASHSGRYTLDSTVPSITSADPQTKTILSEKKHLLTSLLCGGLVALLAVGNYIWWIQNYLVSDSWALLGAIGDPSWSLTHLLPFQQYPVTINSTRYYAPVLISVYWFSLKFCGFSPERLHLLQIALHLCTSILLFSAVLQLTGSQLKATAAGAIFAVHFASTECVGWWGSISHSSAGLFGVLSLTLYVRHLQTKRRIWWFGSLISLVTASLTQVTALPWFAILACLDLFHSWKTCNRQGVKWRLLILGALLLALLVVQLQSVNLFKPGSYSYRFGPWVIRNVFFYPVSTIVPMLEGPSYSLTRDLVLAPIQRDAFTRLMTMNDAFSMLLASGLTVVTVALLWATGNWLVRFSVVSFFVATTPFLLVNGHGYRYLYVPLMFFSLAASTILIDLGRDLWTRSRLGAFAFFAILPIFIVLSAAESQRQLFWWQQAGYVAHKSLLQLKEMQPEFPHGAKVVFGGLPDTLHNTNAQVWRNGMAEAVRVVYGDPALKVEAYTKEEVKRLFREELKGAPNTYGFIWDDWQFKKIAP
jgi:hypothetical protein